MKTPDEIHPIRLTPATGAVRAPFEGHEIDGRAALYPEHVEFQLGGTPAQTQAQNVSEVIRHTDSGAGTAQAERWPPDVTMPDPERHERNVSHPYRDIAST